MRVRQRTPHQPARLAERILIVAPSWVGDAILSEPLVAVLREPLEEPMVDVLAPPWCAPVYARVRGIGEKNLPIWFAI